MKTKKCRGCETELETSAFGSHAKHKDGLQNECKPCLKVKRDAYRKANRDKELAYKREYNEKNREDIRKKAREYYHDNKEARLEYGRRWAAENKDLRNAREQRRRSRKANVADDFTLEQWLDCVAHFEDNCAYCGSHGALQQEHVIPVCKDGGYTVTNIIPACPPCNQSKNGADMEEWFRRRAYFSEERLVKINRYLEEVNACVC